MHPFSHSAASHGATVVHANTSKDVVEHLSAVIVHHRVAKDEPAVKARITRGEELEWTRIICSELPDDGRLPDIFADGSFRTVARELQMKISPSF